MDRGEVYFASDTSQCAGTILQLSLSWITHDWKLALAANKESRTYWLVYFRDYYVRDHRILCPVKPIEIRISYPIGYGSTWRARIMLQTVLRRLVNVIGIPRKV